jgi:hypothetical protein
MPPRGRDFRLSGAPGLAHDVSVAVTAAVAGRRFVNAKGSHFALLYCPCQHRDEPVEVLLAQL